MSYQAAIDQVSVDAYRVPTHSPESDGTLEWDNTTLIVAAVSAGGKQGIGYTYAHPGAAEVIRTSFAELLHGENALDIPLLWRRMIQKIRNAGREGIAACAISAVDIALWDLKCLLFDVPLSGLLGACRASIPIYGSGGFTSYSNDKLLAQASRWAAEGMKMIKMKVGREPANDLRRVSAVKEAVGKSVEVFVDANGAYDKKQAIQMAEAFSESGVVWFEEPCSSDDLDGLRYIREHSPSTVEITAGEYGYDPFYFKNMIAAGSVDVVQADATRCLGITGFMKVGALCETFHLPLSAHTAPSIHLHPCLSLANARHVEYFYDHTRIESMLFEGAAVHENGFLKPDLTRPGLGLTLKEEAAEQYKI